MLETGNERNRNCRWAIKQQDLAGGSAPGESLARLGLARPDDRTGRSWAALLSEPWDSASEPWDSAGEFVP
jgi:hypothetical protein